MRANERADERMAQYSTRRFHILSTHRAPAQAAQRLDKAFQKTGPSFTLYSCFFLMFIFVNRFIYSTYGTQVVVVLTFFVSILILCATNNLFPNEVLIYHRKYNSVRLILFVRSLARYFERD